MQLAVVSMAVSKLAQAKIPQNEATAFTGANELSICSLNPTGGNLESLRKRRGANLDMDQARFQSMFTHRRTMSKSIGQFGLYFLPGGGNQIHPIFNGAPHLQLRTQEASHGCRWRNRVATVGIK
jgi:hypothetical protein